MENQLTSMQQKYLRGHAHSLKPIVFVGQKGIVDSIISALDEAFDQHELIKVKFNEFKEKEDKKALIKIIEQKTSGQLCGLIGHVAILYRQHKNPEKRKISVPKA